MCICRKKIDYTGFGRAIKFSGSWLNPAEDRAKVSSLGRSTCGPSGERDIVGNIIFEDAMFADRGEIPLKLETKEIGARSSLFRKAFVRSLLLLLPGGAQRRSEEIVETHKFAVSALSKALAGTISSIITKMCLEAVIVD